jgi:KipI family sensor histidine kinase inhibitor
VNVRAPGADGAAGWFRVVAAGDAALVVEFEERIDPAVNARAIALAETVRAADIAGVRDVVPTYRSVAVYFDPLRTAGDALLARLEQEASRAAPAATGARAPVRIPVCYGGAFGPDLAHVAQATGLAEGDVVARHCAATYRVFMLGFVPGFAYLGLVDPSIAAPRHSIPRTRVPAGSVGIAGRQTGIYPSETPGGWQIIGRTPVLPFDPRRAEPFLMKAGDAVRFEPIDRPAFETLVAETRA